jgi:hypothetical protein
MLKGELLSEQLGHHNLFGPTAHAVRRGVGCQGRRSGHLKHVKILYAASLLLL